MFFDFIIKYTEIFVEKMREAFLTFFHHKYWHIWEIIFWKFNETLTNDVVSFEQPGPGSLSLVSYVILTVFTRSVSHQPPGGVQNGEIDNINLNSIDWCKGNIWYLFWVYSPKTLRITLIFSQAINSFLMRPNLLLIIRNKWSFLWTQILILILIITQKWQIM